MTQPPKGPGALTLLLRLTMLRSRQQGGGSLAEQGYALAVALITSFVLLLGVAALASRGQLGFVGQVFQVQNRQARDVAESAIAEFADTLNREENRFLLIANDDGSDWNNVINRNHCLAFDDNQNPIAGRDPRDPTTLPTITPSTPGTPGVRDRFRVGPDFRNLRSTGPNPGARQFRVEQIDYLPSARDNNQVDRQLLINAVDRGLIRVTMVGRFDSGNGRVSEARIAREFEVVPKCCNQSFGANSARNWGRDREACEVLGVSQFRVSLNGGTVNGNGKAITVLDQDGNPVTQGVCWNGSDNSDPDNILTGTANTDCTLGKQSIPSKDGGITFAPARFDFNPPPYASSAPVDYLSQVTGNEVPQELLNVLPNTVLSIPSGDHYIYFDDLSEISPGVPYNNLKLCRVSGSGLTDCDDMPNDTKGNPVCYTRILESTSARAPYHEVNCRLSRIDSGNQTLFIDTSSARINFFFDDTSLTDSSQLFGGAGNTTMTRVHCRWGATDYYSSKDYASDRCRDPLEWNAPSGNDFQQVCQTSAGETCGLTKSDGTLYNTTYFDVSELFNIYATSRGTIDLRGNASSVGFNFYAPFASLVDKGGGKSDPNFAGRLWVDSLDLRGNISVRVPTSPPSGFDDGLKAGLWDFRARSFTQSSGF